MNIMKAASLSFLILVLGKLPSTAVSAPETVTTETTETRTGLRGLKKREMVKTLYIEALPQGPENGIPPELITAHKTVYSDWDGTGVQGLRNPVGDYYLVGVFIDIDDLTKPGFILNLDAKNTIILGNDSLIFEGVVVDASIAVSVKYAVVGGTGKYALARGEVQIMLSNGVVQVLLRDVV
jgi:hypothetical protein